MEPKNVGELIDQLLIKNNKLNEELEKRKQIIDQLDDSLRCYIKVIVDLEKEKGELIKRFDGLSEQYNSLLEERNDLLFNPSSE
jgi:flagellar motility protein MotE (MotC chaperone)